jgi:peptide/nickel transport system permease protein
MRQPVATETTSEQGVSGEVQYRQEGLLAATWHQFIRHPGAVAGSIVLIIVVLASIFSYLSPYDPEKSDIAHRLEPPSWQHPMGTDPLGRDVLTRVLYGGRISLFVAVMVVVIALLIGVPIGALAGYSGGWVDNLLMRITDGALTLPSLLVLILLSAILYETELPFFERDSPMTIAVVIGLLSWMTTARLVRAGFLAIREREFVVAANAVGASHFRIMVRHILPNALSPVIVEATLEMGYAIMQESGLSFLGLGIQPPTPSWGNLLSNAQAHLSPHPWLAVFPGLMIFVTIISVNYIGDGLRDALDPYKVLTEVGEV